MALFVTRESDTTKARYVVPTWMDKDGGQGATGAGGSGFSFEFVFKPLTTYLLRLTNVNGQEQMAELRIDWYE